MTVTRYTTVSCDISGRLDALVALELLMAALSVDIHADKILDGDLYICIDNLLLQISYTFDSTFSIVR